MKVQTSITISKKVLNSIYSLLVKKSDRSDFIKQILQEFLTNMRNASRNLEDLEILNKNAERLNKEAEDVLAYQVKL